MNAAGYTRGQRLTALLYGLACHALFVLGVAAMIWGLFTGLRFGKGTLSGAAGFAANALLLVQFPLVHSFLLGPAGRKRLARLAPLGLGADLATTTFAILASVQLLLTFVLWSPSGVLWHRPAGVERVAWTVLYTGSWLFLVKTMQDAGLSIQLGSLGWTAVFRNRKPAYAPFKVRGSFRYVRQPVYIAFATVLWTAPDWTPDRLWIAGLWTAYCVLGPLFKEQRYLKRHGEAYAAYQRTVPYFVPRLNLLAASPPVASASFPRSCATQPVVVAGAGPVGLLLANLLGRAGIRTLVVDPRTRRPDASMAIGVTPPSLEILRPLGLDRPLIAAGVRIACAAVHDDRGEAGRLSLDQLPGDYPFILSVPQAATMQLLEDALESLPAVTRRRGVSVSGYRPSGDGADVTLRDESSGLEDTVGACFLAACDGGRSAIRAMAGMCARESHYGVHFLMADFEDCANLDEGAQLFFTRHGSVEGFPLPFGRRRWIVQTEGPLGGSAAEKVVEDTVRERTGIELRGLAVSAPSAFSPRRLLVDRYFDGPVAFCGDAAHVLSPIGGQGMNTGFADAEFLARVLELIVRGGADPAPLLAAYDRYRRRAFEVACARAARGMWLGTRRGAVASALRSALLRHVLLAPAVRDLLPAYFAMQTIPFNTLRGVPGMAIGERGRA